ncbi:hypothetical protein BX616_003104 [Lobosporangium transversale]|uniref:NAD(P)-binding protein n=1 Tax=Lobosporangium transversale TaxID=64571 RepID=A0A1Y2GGR3_9FUNG|nr:hypothetical protein BCR41DRAFT_131503 [Lobosporangium transversale]KAF9899316.1 hypothetical protein BX616_003104 [Lobosporangium transversale]ORZ10361.1 hypothetical protein BCR41DRAFT_131503 [Lobosporangium transversale]|eukprot:XP_021879268.1 hypothetical protein BCR41DRAFT_131503 [Lobosporangium transversale]
MLDFIYNVDYWKTFVQPSNFSLENIPDLTSKVAIVTGANAGLGYETALELARHGAHVFLACRNQTKALEAIEKMEKELAETAPQLYPKVDFLFLDLSNLRIVAQSAKEFLSKGLPLHILINNAGLGLIPSKLSKDGIENVFAVNHMGHFLFTQLLLPKIIESQPSRVVILSSLSHALNLPEGGIQFGTLSQVDAESAAVNYNRSKLANILYTKALARRLTDAGHDKVFVNSLHPGYCYTGIDNETQALFGHAASKAIIKTRELVGRPAVDGTITSLYCATSPEIEEKSLTGRFFVPDAHELRPSSYAMDEELQERLYKYSEDFMVKRGLLLPS